MKIGRGTYLLPRNKLFERPYLLAIAFDEEIPSESSDKIRSIRRKVWRSGRKKSLLPKRRYFITLVAKADLT